MTYLAVKYSIVSTFFVKIRFQTLHIIIMYLYFLLVFGFYSAAIKVLEPCNQMLLIKKISLKNLNIHAMRMQQQKLSRSRTLLLNMALEIHRERQARDSSYKYSFNGIEKHSQESVRIQEDLSGTIGSTFPHWIGGLREPLYKIFETLSERIYSRVIK